MGHATNSDSSSDEHCDALIITLSEYVLTIDCCFRIQMTLVCRSSCKEVPDVGTSSHVYKCLCKCDKDGALTDQAATGRKRKGVLCLQR